MPNSVSVSLKESGSAIKLSWNKIPQATGYKIYRMSRNTNGKYVLYKTITSNSKTSYRDTGVKQGKAYYYQIKAYRAIKKNTYYSSPSTIRCMAGLSAPSISIGSKLSRANLTWKRRLLLLQPMRFSIQPQRMANIRNSVKQRMHFITQKSSQQAKPTTSVFVLTDMSVQVAIQRNTRYSEHIKQGCKISKNAYGVSVGGTYVEISINQQHMWYYKNGKLVVETDVVTGNYGTNDTPKGAYSIIYKASPATLMNNSHVTFWLPFTSDGCGIHDASWRSSWEYGGTRYKGHGSHGCVNTPYNAVKKIYNNISSGTRVVVY